ncbi:MAG: hypothetical protein Q9170_006851, partial [Blastenia crenularia]
MVVEKKLKKVDWKEVFDSPGMTSMLQLHAKAAATAVHTARAMEDPDEDDDSTELPELEEKLGSSAKRMLPSPSPPKKRRRIDPSPALSKPFKSPFKTPLKTSSQSKHDTPTS